MFDFAWSELGLIAVVSVLVLGPKQLPETMRTVAKVMRKVRSLGAEFQGHMNEMVRQAELEELREQVKKISSTNLSTEVTKMVDPGGEITSALNPQAPPALETPATTPPAAATEAPPVAAPETPPAAAPTAAPPPPSGTPA